MWEGQHPNPRGRFRVYYREWEQHLKVLNLRRSTIEIQQHNRSQRPQGSTLHILDFGNGDTVSNVTLIEQGAWRGSRILDWIV